ncbi:MAG TPA: malto-oligosyltrehalose synthase [Sandaracinaceae bacterium LLY-WYZ-13_1]|nr:malto-oligosyltrehalose synthase [Sandaracinaceae bacterium LLY-WYZ-13_1]
MDGAADPRPLVATYRLQLSPDFGFDAAAALVPYLAELGVSHLYLSPITEARPGSPHGYDVVDHSRVRDELGGDAGFEALRSRCVAAGLGLVLDFVPNHAGIGPSNEAWQDVLCYGAVSPWADTFDLELGGDERILLPFLGRYYGEALDGGELSLVYEGGHLAAAYFEHRFRLRPESYRTLLARWFPTLGDDPERGTWARLLEDYRALDGRDRDRAEALRARLAELDPSGLSAMLAELPSEVVHDVLEEQRFRLAFWQTAGAEINYRRFFDINDLAGLRMESPEVFARSHAKLAELLAKPGVDGVRIDHIDGLYDPRGYLLRLRELGAPHVWVEKILATREALPESWAIDGTTGYVALNDLLRVLVWPGGERALTRLWHRYGGHHGWEDTVHEAKRLVMRTSLSGELSRLAVELHEMSRADYHTRDFTRPALSHALEEVIAALDRYRTYLPDDRAEGEAAVKEAVARAIARNPADEPSVYEHVGRAILGPLRDDLEADRQLWVGRLQQYTAPVAAKGVEDTAFYRYHRLSALCEVGGEPDRFSLGRRAFHSRMRHRAQTQPLGLTATATHDHKRGEDTRMRLALLSELHKPWGKLSKDLARLGRSHRSPVGPSPADSMLFHQLFVALHGTDAPDALRARLVAYMEKATREAKARTSWIRPDPTYEEALRRYVEGMMGDEAVHAAVAPLAERLARLGFANTISQTVLKHTVAGVPDVYRGTERLDLSLVDPDNRRPVDFEERAAWLRQMRDLLEAPDPDVLRRWREAGDERLKLFVIARLLRVRRADPALFSHGSHRGLDAPTGVIAFTRRRAGQTVLVAVPRFPSRPPKSERGVRLAGVPRGVYEDVLGGGAVELGEELHPRERPLPWVVLLKR